MDQEQCLVDCIYRYDSLSCLFSLLSSPLIWSRTQLIC